MSDRAQVGIVANDTPNTGPVSIAYFVLSVGTASWPFLTVVSTLTVVSVVTIVVSWVCLGVTTVSFAGPISVCPP
jgi:hypothetical protein